MSETEQLRPEVVEAIVAVLKGADPSGLPPGATRAEKDAAKDRYLSEFVALKNGDKLRAGDKDYIVRGVPQVVDNRFMYYQKVIGELVV